MTELLTDATTTGVVIVASPEEMPVTESLELIDRLADTKVDVAAVIVNRVLPELFARGEEEIFERLERDGTIELLSSVVGGPAGAVIEAARLAVTLRRTRAEHLSRLRAGVEATLPILYLPELFARSHGMRATTVVAERLGEEL